MFLYENMYILLATKMPKNDKTSSKPAVVSAKSSGGGGKTNRFSRDKERAHLARTSYKGTVKSNTKTVSYKCPTCKDCFVFKNAYDIHRKSCGLPSCVSCTETNLSNPTDANISDIRGDRYKALSKRKPEWMPRFHLVKQLNVVVDEETGKTEKRWITVKKFQNFQALMDDDGETVIDETAGADLQYVDPSELNREGDDQSIIDE